MRTRTRGGRWAVETTACAFLALVIAVLLLSATAVAAPVSSSERSARAAFDGRVVFGVAPTADLPAVLRKAGEWGGPVETPLATVGVYTMLPRNVGASELRAALSRIDGVVWVEPERTVTALAAPNDPRFWDQKALLKMQVARAWETSPGSSSVIVGVVDSGVGPHPDLAGRILPGYNVADPDHPDDTSDGNGHGTAVAGIIAAGVHDHSGIAGVTQRVRILPVVVLDADGVGTDVGAAQGIIWAVDHGADVINVSLGGQWASSALESAVQYADRRGVVVVAAVGNDGNGTVRYPAALSEVIAVAGTDSSDEPAASSNQGPEVDVAAPGVHVLSTGFLDESQSTPTTLAFSGTSFSAAFVAGLAALILSKDPSLDPGAVRALIEDGATDVGAPGRDPATGEGRVDAAASLSLMAGASVAGDVTAPRAPSRVTVSAVPGEPSFRLVRVESLPDEDRTGIILRRTFIRPARAATEGVLVGTDDSGEAVVNLTDPLPPDVLPGRAYYYTAFARDAAGNTSNPTWTYTVTAGDPLPGSDLPPWPDLAPGPSSFEDVPADHPFAEAISALSQAGVVGGFADGSFRPDAPVARAQFAKMVVLSVGVAKPTPTGAATFGDVPLAEGYPFVYVEAAAAAGIVRGLGTTTSTGAPQFGPYESVSRLQVASMLARAGGEKLDPPPPGIVHPFYDVPAYADTEVQSVWAMDIVKGRSAVSFDPWIPATRGQVAQMLFRLRSVLRARP